MQRDWCMPLRGRRLGLRYALVQRDHLDVDQEHVQQQPRLYGGFSHCVRRFADMRFGDCVQDGHVHGQRRLRLGIHVSVRGMLTDVARGDGLYVFQSMQQQSLRRWPLLRTSVVRDVPGMHRDGRDLRGGDQRRGSRQLQRNQQLQCHRRLQEEARPGVQRGYRLRDRILC